LILDKQFESNVFSPLNPVLHHTMPPTPLVPWFDVDFRQTSGVCWPVLVPLWLYQYDCCWPVSGLCALKLCRFSCLSGSTG